MHTVYEGTRTHKKALDALDNIFLGPQIFLKKPLVHMVNNFKTLFVNKYEYSLE